MVLVLAGCGSAPQAISQPPPPPPPAVIAAAVPVVVIDLDCEDATEEQADALTGALRSRVRDTAPWQLDPQRPSMTTLIPALS